MRRHAARGFTLLELMIVLVVVAILAAFAIPSYIEQVHKSRRADAIRTLGQLQLGLERWRAENPCYGRSAGAGCPNTLVFTESGAYPALPTATDSPYYSLDIPAASATPTGYVITATRRTGSAQAKDRCGDYTFTLAGGVLSKTLSNNASGSTPSNCSL
jgi:type IV pilus assembly protein PilE